MMIEMKCLKCGGEKFWGVDFDGYSLQCKDCKSAWNSKYSFFLARNKDETENQAKKGGNPITAKGGSAS